MDRSGADRHGDCPAYGNRNEDRCNGKRAGSRRIMNEAGFDAVPVVTDLSSRNSICALIAEGQKYGEIQMLVNAAGVSPSQAPIEMILKVDLYGTAVLLEEVGKVIADGGATASYYYGPLRPAE